jgi:hypothetical protein
MHRRRRRSEQRSSPHRRRVGTPCAQRARRRARRSKHRAHCATIPWGCGRACRGGITSASASPRGARPTRPNPNPSLSPSPSPSPSPSHTTPTLTLTLTSGPHLHQVSHCPSSGGLARGGGAKPGCIRSARPGTCPPRPPAQRSATPAGAAPACVTPACASSVPALASRLGPPDFGCKCASRSRRRKPHHERSAGYRGRRAPLAERSLAWLDGLLAACPAGAGRARPEGAAASSDQGGARGAAAAAAAAARPPHRAQDPHRAPLRVHAARGSASLLLPSHWLQDTHRAPRGRCAPAARAFAPSRLCLRAEPRPRGSGWRRKDDQGGGARGESPSGSWGSRPRESRAPDRSSSNSRRSSSSSRPRRSRHILTSRAHPRCSSTLS